MKKFSEFGIKVESTGFVGDQIKVKKILNNEITVHRYEIKQSKFDGLCLYAQIEKKGEKYLLWTGSTGLISQIQQVPQEGFPFVTTIVAEAEKYFFT